MRNRVLLTMLAAVLALLPAVPARAAPPQLRVLTFNACGNVCRLGEVDVTTRNIVYQVRGRNAAVAMVQELCFTQFLVLRNRLAKYGYRAVFGAATNGGRCANDLDRHGRGFGVAILARGPLSGQVVHRLPAPHGSPEEGRVVLAVTARLPGRTVFLATTHTAPRGPNLDVQLGALRGWLTPISRTRPVIFGGDLNVTPRNRHLDGFYAGFHEANNDRLEPLPTFTRGGSKIDYLFAGTSHFRPRGAATSCTAYSDHCMYLGIFQ
ncbi:endonuclease/exonuclease/phosphatase family protein [Paractinoplanes rishiriensis]|uniref:Endonuclease/exonuclease/phosphatase domain-containing protein n=1 Tax=Paractinoplanes rishiriensis TaxID=1050105 RepID=A0A919K0N8_9ACTN|nr:endonuclease/exonuclease/phosphatase family protein [Actinoplanes rishiriensis]GIE94466.1 hypothetical protein Ari01nite_19310 [Actinoplanes rishiriensis]